MKKITIILLAFITVTSVASAQKRKWQTLQVHTSAICNECKDRIEKAMAYEKGIKKSDLDVDTKVLTVVYNPEKTNPDKIRKAIAAVGYDADSVPADANAYNELPSCCKKDSKEK